MFSKSAKTTFDRETHIMKRVSPQWFAAALVSVMMVAISGTAAPPKKAPPPAPVQDADSGCQWCVTGRSDDTTWRWFCRITSQTGRPKWCKVEPDGSTCVDYGVCRNGFDDPPPIDPGQTALKGLESALSKEDFRTSTIFRIALESMRRHFGNAWPTSANVHLALNYHTRPDKAVVTMLPTVHIDTASDKITMTITEGRGVPQTAMGKSISAGQ